MKNAKLLVIALIFAAIFSVGAVGAADNFNATSSDFTQVPHEQVVSVAEPTPVQEVETIDLETSEEENSDATNKIELDSDDLKSTDSYEESLSNYENTILKAGRTITLDDHYFYNLRNAIEIAGDGDTIDLEGKTITGDYSYLTVNKRITIINGILNPSSSQTQGMGLNNCRLVNITFQNYYYDSNSPSWPINFAKAELEDVSFINISIPVAFGTAENTKFENCKFINMTSRLGHDDDDFEWGAMLIMYTSEINNSLFYNCTTNRHSGAICVAGRSGNIVNITNTDFINCHAGIGGAIYVHGTDTTANHYSNIINCNFINCSASEWVEH